MSFFNGLRTLMAYTRGEIDEIFSILTLDPYDNNEANMILDVVNSEQLRV